MSDYFDIAVNFILDEEGGYVNDPKDSGGETKWGISKRSYPTLDIPSLTKIQARKIYRTDYWNRVRGDYLPFPVAVVLFDMAVNMGVKRSVKILQGIVGTKRDGKFGAKTMAACMELNHHFLAEQLTIERLKYYASLDSFDRYGAGWQARSVRALTTGILMPRRV